MAGDECMQPEKNEADVRHAYEASKQALIQSQKDILELAETLAGPTVDRAKIKAAINQKRSRTNQDIKVKLTG